MDNTSTSIKLLGTLAIERGWVNNKEVELALDEQKPGEFFGEILLRKKLLSVEQLEKLLLLQKETNIKSEDFLFGQIAIQNQFVKAEEVFKALEEQKSFKSSKSLGVILIEKKLLTKQQCAPYS